MVIGMKKTIITLLIGVLLFLIVPVQVSAASGESENTSDIYDKQLEKSGADQLYYSLPEETKQILSSINYDSLEPDKLMDLKYSSIMPAPEDMITAKGQKPLQMLMTASGILLICALAGSAGILSTDSPLKRNISAVGSLCICGCCIYPLCSLVAQCSAVIEGAAGFMSMYAPVMAGLMLSSSHPMTGSAYYTSLMGTSEMLGLLCSKLILPFLNVFLALSVVSSLSPGLDLSGICKVISKCMKWILNFALGIFVTIISAQTIITSSMDEMSSRAVKFAVNSFVPFVGGVLSETVNAFSGSLSVLKSGVGVFVIIASACIFLPVLIECIIWRMGLFVLGAAADMLGLELPGASVKSIDSVCSLLTAVLLVTLTVFIISTVIVIIAAR